VTLTPTFADDFNAVKPLIVTTSLLIALPIAVDCPPAVLLTVRRSEE